MSGTIIDSSNLERSGEEAGCFTEKKWLELVLITKGIRYHIAIGLERAR